ncbi:hypothetical protein GCM10010273_53210 [Streptomyces lavendulocolor]
MGLPGAERNPERGQVHDPLDRKRTTPLEEQEQGLKGVRMTPGGFDVRRSAARDPAWSAAAPRSAHLTSVNRRAIADAAVFTARALLPPLVPSPPSCQGLATVVHREGTERPGHDGRAEWVIRTT